MPLLELRGISKTFSRVPVLQRIDFTVLPGEVHALLGENGAGKSTLIKLLSGVYRPDQGQIFVAGEPVDLRSPVDAHQQGIRTIFQESTLLPDLTIAENIFLGSEPRHRWLPMIDERAMENRARELLGLLGVNLEPKTRVATLSPAQQQMIELAKALHVRARLLILDEPTARLTRFDTEAIFRVIRLMQRYGIGIIYISHRLDEVLSIADRATILRDGRRVVTLDVNSSSVDQLVRIMSNRLLSHKITRRTHQPGAEVLRIEALTRQPAFADVSFSLQAGEIVGLAGLVGAGRSALVQTIFGYMAPDAGRVFVDGQFVNIRSPHDAIGLGIGFLPEDRRQQALLLEMTARENLSLAALGRAGGLNHSLIDTQHESFLVEQYFQRMRIQAPNSETPMRYLSGGTQQKIVLSRWLAVHPRIMILDEPTHGIDINTKLEIHHLLDELAAKGMSILLVSSELPELVRLCDRVLIMNRGRLTGTLSGAQLTQDALAQRVIGEKA
jgi:ABC-type sugar transport system ATPase subunit